MWTAKTSNKIFSELSITQKMLFDLLNYEETLIYEYFGEKIREILEVCGPKSLFIKKEIENFGEKLIPEVEKYRYPLLKQETDDTTKKIIEILSGNYLTGIKMVYGIFYYGFQNEPEEYEKYGISVIDIIPIKNIDKLWRYNDYISYYFDKFKIIDFSKYCGEIPQIFNELFINIDNNYICPKCGHQIKEHVYVQSLASPYKRKKIALFEKAKEYNSESYGCKDEYIVILNNSKIGFMNKFELKQFIVKNEFMPETPPLIEIDMIKQKHINRMKIIKQQKEEHHFRKDLILQLFASDKRTLDEVFPDELINESFVTWISNKNSNSLIWTFEERTKQYEYIEDIKWIEEKNELYKYEYKKDEDDNVVIVKTDINIKFSKFITVLNKLKKELEKLYKIFGEILINYRDIKELSEFIKVVLNRFKMTRYKIVEFRRFIDQDLTKYYNNILEFLRLIKQIKIELKDKSVYEVLDKNRSEFIKKSLEIKFNIWRMEHFLEFDDDAEKALSAITKYIQKINKDNSEKTTAVITKHAQEDVRKELEKNMKKHSYKVYNFKYNNVSYLVILKDRIKHALKSELLLYCECFGLTHDDVNNNFEEIYSKFIKKYRFCDILGDGEIEELINDCYIFEGEHYCDYLTSKAKRLKKMNL